MPDDEVHELAREILRSAAGVVSRPGGRSAHLQVLVAAASEEPVVTTQPLDRATARSALRDRFAAGFRGRGGFCHLDTSRVPPALVVEAFAAGGAAVCASWALRRTASGYRTVGHPALHGPAEPL